MVKYPPPKKPAIKAVSKPTPSHEKEQATKPPPEPAPPEPKVAEPMTPLEMEQAAGRAAVAEAERLAKEKEHEDGDTT